MKFVKIKYLAKGTGVSADSFKRWREEEEHLNLNQISSVSGVTKFTSISGEVVGECACVRMVNKDCFYISKEEHEKLIAI